MKKNSFTQGFLEHNHWTIEVFVAILLGFNTVNFFYDSMYKQRIEKLEKEVGEITEVVVLSVEVIKELHKQTLNESNVIKI